MLADSGRSFKPSPSLDSVIRTESINNQYLWDFLIESSFLKFSRVYEEKHCRLDNNHLVDVLGAI